MNAFFEDPVFSIAAALVLKASVILGIAAALDAGLRRRASAAARHAVWTLALAGVLVLPALTFALPRWAFAVRAASPAAALATTPGTVQGVDLPAAPPAGTTAAASGVRVATVTPPAAKPAWPDVLFRLYVVGVLAVLAYVALERFRLWRLLRETREATDPEWQGLLRECASVIDVHRPVRLLRSRVGTMPMAVGTRRPAIVIPAIGDTWPGDRRRAVLLHELAHVARLDCLTQTLAVLACSVYWFHPGAWWAAYRLRVERELACDDLVLAAGAPARDYAGHLLEIAYSSGSDRAPALAVGMARRRHIEGRLLAVLDRGRNRRVPAPRARLAGAAIAALLIVPLAAATATVAPPEAQPEAAFEQPARTAEAPPARVHTLPKELKSTAAELSSAARRRLRAAAAAFGLQALKGTGTWEVRPSKRDDGTVHLRLTEGDSSWGRSVRLEQLEGLTAAQLSAGGPVQFKLRRDAGTFAFEGVVRGGVGAGTFSFAPDPAFAEGLAKRGYARPTASEQYALARADVGYAFLDELTKQGYAKPTTAELVRAGEHGVHTDYLRDMGALGYRLGTLAPLITLRDHGVGPEYVRALAEQGYKGLSADELRRARDHGVSPEYAAAMREAGYGSLPMEQLVNARDHGVSGDYAREMRALGYQVALEDLVRARDHGVNVEFVRELAGLGYKGQPLDGLVRLRDHGVSIGFVKELKSLGYDALPVEDLVRLRDHGLNAERIRAANARAGTRLPVDLLIRLGR